MKVVDVILDSVQPLSMKALLDNNETVDIVNNPNGEALIQIEDTAVERYTALHSLPEFDASDFWHQLSVFQPRLLMVPDDNAFTGFRPYKWTLLGTLSTIANYEGNAVIDKVLIKHSYNSKSFMPSLNKDIAVEYHRAEQEAPSHLFYFVDLMDKIAALGEEYSSQFMVAKDRDSITTTVKYKGVRDNRHLEMNKVFDNLLGNRHVEEKK